MRTAAGAGYREFICKIALQIHPAGECQTAPCAILTDAV